MNAGDAKAGDVLAEIDTYLTGRRAIFTWLLSVRALLGRVNGDSYNSYVHEFGFVRTHRIERLPDEYALEYFNVAEGQWYYRTAYVERPEVPQSRVAMLSGVACMLTRFEALQNKIMTDERIPTGQARNRCIADYAGVVTNLEKWMRVARPHVVPGVQAVHRREEEGGRVFKRTARMQKVQALLDELETSSSS